MLLFRLAESAGYRHDQPQYLIEIRRLKFWRRFGKEIRAITTKWRLLRRLRWPLARFGLRWWVRPYIRRLNKPLLAVTGTNGKTTVSLLLEKILSRSGRRVGLATTYEVRRDGRVVAEGDYAWGYGVWLAARDPKMNALVVETARGGMVNDRFGFDECHVAIVTNVSEDHLGQSGIDTLDQMAELKSGLVRRLAPEGTAVLNADDPRVRAMGSLAPRAIYFSLSSLPLEFEHCFYVDDQHIWRRAAGTAAPVVALSDIALYGGGLLSYNLLNVMAVLAALDGLADTIDVDQEIILDVLRTFGSSIGDHPYSFNFLSVYGHDVLLTESKNAAGFREHAASIERLCAQRGYRKVVGFITHVGDQRREVYEDCGRIAARVSDQLFVTPPKEIYRRNRSDETIMEYLAAGVPKNKLRRTSGADILEIAEELDPNRSGDVLFVVFDALVHASNDVPKVYRDGKLINLSESHDGNESGDTQLAAGSGAR